MLPGPPPYTGDSRSGSAASREALRRAAPMTIAAGVRTMILNIARRVTLAADDPIICQRASAARHVVRRGAAGLPRSADRRRWAYRSLVRDGTGAGLRPGGPAGLGILARDAHVPQRRPVLSATPSLEGGPRRSAFQPWCCR